MADSIWWTKMLHKEDFCEHFCEMSDKEIVDDIRKSIASFMKQREEGEDFGAKMVHKAKLRIDSVHDVRSDAGKQGGRPRKDTTADGDTREGSQDCKSRTSANIYGDAATSDGAEVCRNRESGAVAPTTISDFSEARQSMRTGCDSVRRVGVASPVVCHKSAGAPVRNSGRRFRNKEEYMQWAIDSGLDATDASECWDATLERGGKDADGNGVKNIKAFAVKWCKTRDMNRRSA